MVKRWERELADQITSTRRLRNSGVTRSASEAIGLLQQYRGLLIAWGRHLGAKHAMEHGTVHTRIVRAAMAERGWLRPDVGDYWLGAVFCVGCFVWTGDWYGYHDPNVNGHHKHIKVWRATSIPPAPLAEPLSVYPREPAAEPEQLKLEGL